MPETRTPFSNHDQDSNPFRAERSRRAILWSAIAAGSVALALGAGAFSWQVNGAPPVSVLEKAVPTEQTIIVQPQSIMQHLDITGTIGAGKAIAIVAPFDGVIREKLVQLGDHVNVGDVLVVMDTSEIASRYRDAQSSYIKAAIAADALANWESSPDVLRARRSLEAAELSLSMLDRQVSELKSLLDKGSCREMNTKGSFSSAMRSETLLLAQRTIWPQL